MIRLSSLLLALATGSALLAQEPTTQPTKPPTTQPAQKADPMHPRFKMETTLGDIILELDAEKAPITVLNFHSYVESGYYDGTIFHRVMSNFMIQGGGFTADMEKKTADLLPPIKNEWKNGLKNITGSIAMARLGRQPDSATSQFFINVKDNASLDAPRDGAAYAVFGKVIEGMDTVKKIENVEVQRLPERRMANVPVETVVIKSVKLITEFDPSKVREAIKAAEAAAEAEKKRAQEEIEAAKKAKEQARAAREKEMQEYAKKIEDETGKKFTKTDSGLMYIVLQEGTGDTSPQPTDTVEVHYTGWLLDGTKFDSSVDRGAPSSFRLNGVIKGWTEGVGLMVVGEKRKLIILPEFAYGALGRPGIPPNSTLVFDIELLAIK